MTSFSPLTLALASAFSVSAISLIVLSVISIPEAKLRRLTFFLVSLAMGAMFGDVALHLLPEVFRDSTSARADSTALLVGLGCSFVLEKFLRWKHEHGFGPPHSHAHPPAPDHAHGVKPVGRILLVSDGLHNFVDGLLIGASYLASPAIGLATTLAVVLHEIPHEIGDFSVLLDAGYTRGQALALNFAFGGFSVAGAGIAFLAGRHVTDFTPLALSLTAGFLLYIAGSNLTPEMQKENSPRRSAGQLAGIFLGVGLMYAMLWLER